MLTHTHTHTHTQAYTYTQKRTLGNTLPLMHTHTRIHIHTHIHTHLHTFALANTIYIFEGNGWQLFAMQAGKTQRLIAPPISLCLCRAPSQCKAETKRCKTND